MPFLNQLDTKAKQLEALRTVRKQAAVSFKTLEEEKMHMTHLMKQLHLQRNGGSRGSSYVTFEGANYTDEEQNTPLTGAPAKGNYLYFQ